MKKLWAVLTGIAVAVVVVIVGDILSHKIYPLPEGLDFTDQDQVAAYMKVIPSGALIAVIVGQLLGLLAGGLVVIKMAKESKPLHIFCLIFILMSIMNLLMIAHPMWFAIASIAGLALVYFTLYKLINSSKKHNAPQL